MDRSLYSLILMDSVVSEIDKIALRRNTNRSNLINQILADYVSLMTPEKRITNIFKCIEDILTTDSEIIPFVLPNSLSMSMKSSLEYKYRPTIRYEVQLYRVPNGAIGELIVAFRTQSQALLDTLTQFFRLWKRLEDVYISDLYPENAISYELYDGKFIRSIAVPKDKNYSNEQLGTAISNYVQMFDTLMKGYINNHISPKEIEAKYLQYLNKNIGLI